MFLGAVRQVGIGIFYEPLVGDLFDNNIITASADDPLRELVKYIREPHIDQVLLKRRFGILHPGDSEGERSAERFAAAVAAWGGEVVVTASFPVETTDFREPIGKIRAGIVLSMQISAT